MRKAIIDVVPNKMVRKMWGGFFDHVDRMEGRELLQLNFEKGVKLVIADIFVKDSYTIDDVEMPSPVKILNVLKRDGQRYTVLIKAVVRGKVMSNFMKLFNLDLVYDMPYHACEDGFRMSCIGDNRSVNKLVKLLGLLGEVEKVSFTKATFTEYNILNVLTEKQKEILIEAKKSGYYHYPRKINTGQLSERLGISKATTVEHLRKAETRLISNLLEGY